MLGISLYFYLIEIASVSDFIGYCTYSRQTINTIYIESRKIEKKIVQEGIAFPKVRNLVEA